ncbi:MAG: TRAP transporter small permease subunit [Paracoccaceae bacterium]
MDRAFNKLTHGLLLVGGLGIILMMLNITLDVILKVFWNAPIQGTVEISSYYYMVAIVMLPMAMVEYNDEQISVDLLFNHFPGVLKQASLMITFIATAGMLSIMAWRTGLDAVRAFNVGEVVMGSRQIIVWPARCMLPLGFGLAAVAAVMRAIMLLRGRAVTKLHETDSVA